MRWSDKVKRQALESYKDAGPSVASRLTGVPASTVRVWARDAGLALPDDIRAHYRKHLENLVTWTEEESRAMRADLRGKLIRAATRIVERMEEPVEEFVGAQGRSVTYDIPSPGDTQRLAIAAGILIDKFRLESGEASAVVGSVDVLPKLDDHEKAALAEVLRNAIRERSEAEPEGASAVADVRD